MATVGQVMVKWMVLLPLGRCYSHVSISYFNLSSGMLNRTSYHHQKPPGGPKGQGSYDEEEWGHLQLQMWQGGV